MMRGICLILLVFVLAFGVGADDDGGTVEILQAIAMQNLALTEAKIEAGKAIEKLQASIVTLQGQQMTGFTYSKMELERIRYLLGENFKTHTDGEPLEIPDTAEIYQIGNFIADKGTWTTQAFMSDFLHNGDSPDWNASNVVRAEMISRCKAEGMNMFPLVYAYNDTNWSRRRGPLPEQWQTIKNRELAYSPAVFDRWWHWFVQVRKADMDISVCIFPNDAVDTYNNESVYSRDDLETLMADFIEFTRFECAGLPMVKYIVLKLEAEDEWSIEKINDMAKRARKYLGPRQRLGYHNQFIEDTVGVDWALFDFIAIQVSVGRDESKEGIARAYREAINLIPEHLEIVFAEHTWEGFKPDRGQEIGKYLLDTLPREYPNRVFLGSWNGGR